MTPAVSDLVTLFSLGGFFSGLIVTSSYLILALLALARGSATRWHILIGLSSLVWSVGALTCELSIVIEGYTHEAPPLPAFALKVLATGIWITSGLAIWKTYLDSKVHAQLTLTLQAGAVAAGAFLAGAALYAHFVPAAAAWGDVAVYGQRWFILGYSIALTAYGVRLLRNMKNSPRALWFSTAVMCAGFVALAGGSVARSAYPESVAAGKISFALLKQAPLIVILGSLFLFARFRNADRFIRHSLRVVIGVFIACVTISVLSFTFASTVERPIGPLQLFGAVLVLVVALAFFHGIDRRLGHFIDTWVYRGPDLQQAIADLDQQLSVLHLDEELIQATSASMQAKLECENIKVVPVASLPIAVNRALLAQGEVVESLPPEYAAKHCTEGRLDLVVPVHTAQELTHAIVLTPGFTRRAFVSQELVYARAAGLALGRRFCSLGREREQVERRSREARFLQQVTEAELRALRAQVNPHFLFNALNTVADLIVTDPVRAETMTLRLAQVFRHVLAHSSRSLTSLEEEIGFVEKYLYIEEARFGDRLRVEITVAPGIRKHRVPSLILQPLVENALKHGLGPKPGVGHLWIRATSENEQVCLTVEDDGVGIDAKSSLATETPAVQLTSSQPRSRGAGVGLRNVTERLAALYEKRARFTVEPRLDGGSRVTVRLPLEAEAAWAA